ncbi:MAG: ABC transporter permease [Jatrophihabitans sp.]
MIGTQAAADLTANAASRGPAGTERERRSWRSWRARPAMLAAGFFVLMFCVMAAVPQLFAGWFGHGDPRACNLTHSGLGPASGHPFGYDIQGCDLYSNVVYGARNSISIGFLVTASCLLVSLVLGSLAGYFGGRVDALISRLMDVFFGFPSLVAMIVLLDALNNHTVLTVALVLSLFSWPVLTRVMRSSALSVRRRDYITAERGLGATHLRILVRHVAPNAVGPVLALTGFTVAGVISSEAALTYLGVGLTSPSISWGVQLNASQQYFTDHLNLLIFPAAFLSATVLSFVVFSDRVRDALDPAGQS